MNSKYCTELLYQHFWMKVQGNWDYPFKKRTTVNCQRLPQAGRSGVRKNADSLVPQEWGGLVSAPLKTVEQAGPAWLKPADSDWEWWLNGLEREGGRGRERGGRFAMKLSALEHTGQIWSSKVDSTRTTTSYSHFWRLRTHAHTPSSSNSASPAEVGHRPPVTNRQSVH